jgi:uncharacterized protein (TIGR03435 family)
MRVAVGICLATLAAFGQQAPTLAFDAVSIKPSAEPAGQSGAEVSPGSFRIRNESLKECVMEAYSVRSYQVLGGPDWLDALRFQIDARAERASKQSDLRLMLRAALADRFQLAFHRETRPAPGYALVVGSGGLKITPTDGTGEVTVDRGYNKLTAKNISMEQLASLVSEILATPVGDATGLSGSFDVTLKWTPERTKTRTDENRPRNLSDGAARTSRAAEAGKVAARPPSLPDALDQLGLKLKPRKVDVEFFMIDHAEKPTEN